MGKASQGLPKRWSGVSVSDQISCDCSINPYDYDGAPECSRTHWRKARKQHKCCECRLPIEPGDRYQYISGVWDGRPDSFKTCAPCAQIRTEYCPDGYIFGELRQTLWECLEIDYLYPPGHADAWW